MAPLDWAAAAAAAQEPEPELGEGGRAGGNAICGHLPELLGAGRGRRPTRIR